jgi:hypothetical protein
LSGAAHRRRSSMAAILSERMKTVYSFLSA